MKINLERFKKIIVVLPVCILAVQAGAYEGYEEAPRNYVELGTMKSQSSFEVLSQGQVSDNFVIPVYKKNMKGAGALGPGANVNRFRDVSSNERKASKRQISRLARKLRAMTIYKVPRYNFGREKILKRKKMGWNSENYKSLRSFSLKSQRLPSVLKGLNKKANFNIKSARERNINLKKLKQKVILQAEVDSLSISTSENFDFQVKSMSLREPKDHDLLAADILFEEKKSCEEVVPISQHLHDKKTKDNRVKFYMGMCLHDAKMFSESIPLLSEVIGTSTDYYAKQAVAKILDGLPKGYEGVIAKGLAPKNVYNKLDQKQKDKYNYILAKGNFINEKYKRAEAHAKLVSESSPDRYDAKFLVGTSQYMSGQLPNGIRTMLSLKAEYEKAGASRKDFMSLINLTLARFQFERGDYKSSIKNYELVSRDHPLWVDSLIEKGWAQIKMKDFSGAIGNMFTLHSPFFKDAFIPESYVIRTIGYLNLCQFGDADDTLGYLETEYPEQKRKISSFLEKESDHYKVLKGYLTENTEKLYSYKGLPTSVIREMGRDRDFLMVQTKLNNIVDEIPMFRRFASEVMMKRRKLKSEIASLTKKSKELRLKEGRALKNNNIELAKSYKKTRKSVFDEGYSLSYRIKLFDKGIIEYKKANGNAVKRAEKMRDDYLAQAEDALRDSMGSVDTRLQTVLRNNDLLRYEIFANSGKNIRYRVAGGKIGSDDGASRKPAARSKMDYGWKFKGEFWQDEIGNFKSDLKNLCPRK